MVAARKGGLNESAQGSDIDACILDAVSTSVATRRCKDSLSNENVCNGGTDIVAEVEKTPLHTKLTRNHDRSLSFDRRRAESAQFLEAVGDSSIGSGGVEIVDNMADDSQDDEDEGAYEIESTIIPPCKHHWHAPNRNERLHDIPFAILPNTSWCQSGADGEELNYQGIERHGLEITKCGVQRGNPVTLHRKAWLEVSDSKHRYGKHLRIYYYHWCSLGHPTNNFFHWLDAKGKAASMPLPNLPECPRTMLETDTVLYITDPEITKSYSLSVITNKVTGRARILDADGELVITGAEGWIFVLRDDVLYGNRKVAAITAHSKQRFHHSSFFGGKAVSAAGIFVTDGEGFLTEVHPHSGHYRPGEPDLQRCLCYLYSRGVNLDTFEVDMQQICRISRLKDPPIDIHGECNDKCTTKKRQKKNCLYLKSGTYAAYFLSHKAKAMNQGLFEHIEMRLFMECSESDDTLETSKDSGCCEGKHSISRDLPVE